MSHTLARNPSLNLATPLLAVAIVARPGVAAGAAFHVNSALDDGWLRRKAQRGIWERRALTNVTYFALQQQRMTWSCTVAPL
jgi:hypothetical protein